MNSENGNEIKALHIIVNAGYVDEIMEIVREAGAGGATILNARGTGAMHKMFMGISLDTEKEIILSLVSAEVADKIMEKLKGCVGEAASACPVCFTLPVSKMTKLASADSVGKRE